MENGELHGLCPSGFLGLGAGPLHFLHGDMLDRNKFFEGKSLDRNKFFEGKSLDS